MADPQVSITSNGIYNNTGTLNVTKTALTVNFSSVTNETINDSGLIESGNRGIDTTGTAANGTNLSIHNTGTIQGSDDALRVNSDLPNGVLTVDNSGEILSTTDGQAIDFNSVVTATTIAITNEVGGTIESTDADAIRPGENAIITNHGLIYAGGANGASSNDGIDFQDNSGTVINDGSISAARHGITSSTDVSVTNLAGGSITGRDGSGVGSDGNGTVTNYGTITGAYDGSGTGDGDGVDIDFLAIIDNFGTIQGTGAAGNGSDGLPNTSEGLALGGGTVTNEAGALISGAANGILVDNSSDGDAPYATFVTNSGTIQGLNGYGIKITDTLADTITNYGLISGTTAAIQFGDGDDTLNVETGSAITGLVDGGAGTDTVNLDGTGTFAGATDFEVMTVTGTWELTGDQSYATVDLEAGATLALDGATPASETIDFSAGNATLVIGDLGGTDAVLDGFGIGDALKFSNIAYSSSDSVTVSGDTVTITAGGTQYDLTMTNADPGYYYLAKNQDGSMALEEAACFLAGTMIATPAGEQAIETLETGNLILTADGTAVPLRWLARQTVSRRFGDPLRVVPVRICAGALGEGLPRRDLLVSPDHAFFLDGVLVQVGALVNGVTILRDTAQPERFTYYNLDLGTHCLMLAEGAAVESFVDHIDRGIFDNHADFVALHGATAPIAEMPVARVLSARQLPAALRARFVGELRAAA